jgi:hypothetical protein
MPDSAMTPKCLSCAILTGELQPLGEAILETTFFHAHQDVAYPVPGLG